MLKARSLKSLIKYESYLFMNHRNVLFIFSNFLAINMCYSFVGSNFDFFKGNISEIDFDKSSDA